MAPLYATRGGLLRFQRLIGGVHYKAPGKLVLVGEYAVLDGAPAIVAAVDRGVAVEVTPAERLIVETPGDATYARAALTAVDAPPARYVFSDWNPVGTATKAGFGGSAATCVVAALAGGAPDVWRAADTVHRAVQGGGSGIDVAASAHGGVLRFRREGDAMSVAAEPVVRPVVVWSGASASTGPRVQRYLAWRDRAAFVRESAAIVEAFPSSPIATLAVAYAELRRMSLAAGVDWETPAHAEIAAIARDCGGAAKPSGAGGGDIAVALFPDRASEDGFRDAVRARAYRVIDVNVAPGAHREEPL